MKRNYSDSHTLYGYTIYMHMCTYLAEVITADSIPFALFHECSKCIQGHLELALDDFTIIIYLLGIRVFRCTIFAMIIQKSTSQGITPIPFIELFFLAPARPTSLKVMVALNSYWPVYNKTARFIFYEPHSFIVNKLPNEIVYSGFFTCTRKKK